MTFPPDDWPRVKALFDAALEVDRAARAAFVASACGDDADLRRQVDMLLASHDQAQSFLEDPAIAVLRVPPPVDDVTGRVIGTYRVTAKIGTGGMGEVYAAHDTNLDRPVALKLLSPEVAHDVERLQRFHREARAVSSLNHPHILVIHDFGDVEGRPFMVTELVEGATLRQRMAGGPVPVREAVDIAVQVASALTAAHGRGLVHRDIKPENVMLRPDGYVKVLDFGLAKLRAAAAAEEHEPTIVRTTPGLVLGTPRYMSPEQARGLDVDARSDVWSVGVVLYEMLTGHPPFDGATTSDVLAAILRAEPAPLDLHAVQAPHTLGRLIARTLAKNADDRFPTARDLHAALAALKTELDSAVGLAGAAPEHVHAARRVPNNLPIQITAFVGREDDIAGVRDALQTSRLVTLTGAGGVGKTRLALEVAPVLLEDFADGAWLVDLSRLSDPALVGGAVADVLGVRDRPDRPVADSLCDHLRVRSLLIVLDNCEHVIDACATLVHQLLSACAGIRVLATSREALNVPGETAWKVRSLGVPDPDVDVDRLARAESVQLFTRRARAGRPAFDVTPENAAAVAQICRRLDGLPLAIELAAARMSAMSPSEIATRLDDRFRLLTGGSRMALPRQRTLEATVAWSYDLLSEPERELFDRLTVFAGGWTLDAAERVCLSHQNESQHPSPTPDHQQPGRLDIADLLARLVDRSLAIADETAEGRTRYGMLETLRQFGRDRLIARGDVTGLRNRHLAWAVALAESAPPHTVNKVPGRFAAETDNFRTALEWACETGAYESGLRIISSANWIGTLNQRRRILTRLLPFASQVPIEVQGRALFAAGGLAFMIGDWEWGVEVLSAAADANASAGDALRTSMSLTYLGACRWGLGDAEAARVDVDKAIAEARAARNLDALVRALLIRTWLETERNLDEAEALSIEGEQEAARLGTVFDVGHCREVRGFVHCLKGEFERGAAVLAEAVQLFEDIQINCASHVLEAAAAWATMTGRFELGAEILGSAYRIREETGDKPRPWERAVQDEWLPKIGGALDPAVFDAAHRRGAERASPAALEFAQRELRAAVAETGRSRSTL